MKKKWEGVWKNVYLKLIRGHKVEKLIRNWQPEKSYVIGN